MKRVLTVAAFGGLLMVLAPQATSAGTVAPSDHGTEQGAGNCAGTPQGADQPESEAPRRGPHGDHEQRESDESEILF